MKYERWTRGVLRENLLKMERGEEVVVIRSTIKHRAANLGATFWVMSVPLKSICQVSEYAFGKNIYKLFEEDKEVPIGKQADCEERAKGLLASSVYAPEHRKTKTYLNLKNPPKVRSYEHRNETGT